LDTGFPPPDKWAASPCRRHNLSASNALKACLPKGVQYSSELKLGTSYSYVLMLIIQMPANEEYERPLYK